MRAARAVSLLEAYGGDRPPARFRARVGARARRTAPRALAGTRPAEGDRPLPRLPLASRRRRRRRALALPATAQRRSGRAPAPCARRRAARARRRRGARRAALRRARRGTRPRDGRSQHRRRAAVRHDRRAAPVGGAAPAARAAEPDHGCVARPRSRSPPLAQPPAARRGRNGRPAPPLLAGDGSRAAGAVPRRCSRRSATARHRESSRRAEAQAARDRRAIAAYREGRPRIPGFRSRTGRRAARCSSVPGRVIVAGCRDAGAARALGLVPSHNTATALAMARRARRPRATGVILPPFPFARAPTGPPRVGRVGPRTELRRR